MLFLGFGIARAPAQSVQLQQPTQSQQQRSPSGQQQPTAPLASKGQLSPGKRTNNQDNDGPKWIEIVQAFVAALGLWIAYLIYGVYDQQREIMNAQAAITTNQLDATKRELRAYVGFEDMFFVYESGTKTHSPDEKFTDFFKLRVMNFGNTPAANATVWFKRSKTPINSVEDGAIFGPLTLQPHQRWGRDFFDPVNFPQTTSQFFAAGLIVYEDAIYKKWWTSNFSFRYDFREGDTRGTFSPEGEGPNQDGGPYNSKTEAINAGLSEPLGKG